MANFGGLAVATGCLGHEPRPTIAIASRKAVVEVRYLLPARPNVSPAPAAEFHRCQQWRCSCLQRLAHSATDRRNHVRPSAQRWQHRRIALLQVWRGYHHAATSLPLRGSGVMLLLSTIAFSRSISLF